jgi:hypothetical protein
MFDLRKARFDLEKSFAEWRWQMLAAGVRAPEPLEELELHLREDVEQQLLFAEDPEEAFAAAVRRIGDARAIKSEFNKASRAQWAARLWWLWLAIGGCGLMQTAIMNFVGPLVFHRHSSVFFSQKWWADWFPAYIVWISFTIIGAAMGWAAWRAQRQAARPSYQ